MTLVDLDNVESLSAFKRRTSEFLERIRADGKPLVLTVNGKAEVVVLGAEIFQRIAELLDQAETIEGIRQGLEQAKRGEARPVEEVFGELRRKYEIPGGGDANGD